MAFPASPTNGQVTTKNGISYVYSTTTNSWTRRTALQGGVFNTLTANIGIFSGNTTSASLSSVNMLEKVTTIGPPGATYDFDCLTQSIVYNISDATNDFNINFRGTSTTSLDSVLAVGQSISLVFITKCGTTAYKPATVSVDGAAMSLYWQGGTAPTSGNTSSLDVYSFTIIKLGSMSFQVLAAQTKFSQ